MDLESIRQGIISEIERNREHYISFLQKFVRAPSPNPPGNTTQAARVIVDFLNTNGIASEIIEPLKDAANVVSDFAGGRGPGPRVILNGHIDTFPVEDPDSWEKDPFSGYNDGRAIHGRGSVDMKAGTAASVIAFALLRTYAQHMKGSVGLTAVSDEETGGQWGTLYLLKNCGDRWKGSCVLNGEPGGLRSVRFGEKGTLRITFCVRTPGANGAYKHVSRGANIIASQLVTMLLDIESMEPELPDDLRQYLTSDKVRKVSDNIMGRGASDIILQPTVNIGTMRGGAKVNVIPQQCIFEADIRLPIGMSKQSVLKRIDKILENVPEASYYIQEAASNPANYCTRDHPLADHIIDCAAQITGERPVQLAGLGGTDCKFYRYENIPAYVYGPSPKDMGATEESVLIDEYLVTLKVHTLAIFDYLSKTAS